MLLIIVCSYVFMYVCMYESYYILAEELVFLCIQYSQSEKFI